MVSIFWIECYFRRPFLSIIFGRFDSQLHRKFNSVNFLQIKFKWRKSRLLHFRNLIMYTVLNWVWCCKLQAASCKLHMALKSIWSTFAVAIRYMLLAYNTRTQTSSAHRSASSIHCFQWTFSYFSFRFLRIKCRFQQLRDSNSICRRNSVYSVLSTNVCIACTLDVVDNVSANDDAMTTNIYYLNLQRKEYLLVA